MGMTGTMLGSLALPPPSDSFAAQSVGVKRKVVVIGAGIAGLSCAYEFVAGEDMVTVLEATGRAGGHVRTAHDPFADGLYADLGAEHFYYPGYTNYWRYLKEFSLTAIPYPRRDDMVRFLNGQRYSEEDLHARTVLNRLGFTKREIDFLVSRPWAELPLLYLQPYVDRVRDEADPFAGGLAELDRSSLAELLQREGASPTTLQFFGGSGSALQTIWAAAIKKLRGTDLESKKLFRIKGGNQLMTDAFAARLGDRVRLGCAVTRIEHGASGATASFRNRAGTQARGRLYRLLRLRRRASAHSGNACMAGSQGIRHPRNALLHPDARVLQSRTRFWKTDKISPNWLPSDPRLNELWSMADEVDTKRGILLGEPPARRARSCFSQCVP